MRNPIIVYAVALGISAGAFVMGYSLVCLSMLQQEIAKANGLSTEESTNYLSLLTTALPLGAILGSLLLRPLCTKFGENRTMILIDLFALAAFVIQGTELTIPHLLLGRIMVGVCCGISSGIIPQYLASISPRAAFGVIGTFNQLLITIGIASAYYAGNFLPGTAPSSNLLSPETFIALPSLFCIARIVLLLFFPYDTVERHYGNK